VKGEVLKLKLAVQRAQGVESEESVKGGEKSNQWMRRDENVERTDEGNEEDRNERPMAPL
jgi:hypothetical protein